jgi:hypothetical protein
MLTSRQLVTKTTGYKIKKEKRCQIKLRSLQSIRLSTSTDGCTFGPRKASKVEKPSSRGVSSLHCWSLMLLPVLWLMPLRSLHTCMCVYYTVSTQLCVAATLLLLPGAGTNKSDRPLGLIVVTHLDNMTERTNRIGDLTRHRVS